MNKVLLCVLDGFGLRENGADNAIIAASKPTYDRLMKSCPFTELQASGGAVGLPDGQMGNSEVGHLNLGAGRVVPQDIVRIDKAIKDESFYDNNVLATAMKRVATAYKAVHLFGLVSDGGVHSSLNHLYALVKMAKIYGVKELYLHAFMDGRDTPPTSGSRYMREVQQKFYEIGLGKVSTVGGRYYGMDRDRRWERTDKAYRAIVYGEGEKFKDPVKAIEASYAKGVTDEFIIPVVIDMNSHDAGRLRDLDLVVMFNFRSDRARQLSYMFCGYDIKGYIHHDKPRVEVVTMTQFDVNMFEAKVAFHPISLKNILGEVLAKNHLRQLRTAETEKYAHVTFFFNGGVEEPFELEERDMIASPKVATYDLQPEMSSVLVTDNAVKRIDSGDFNFVLLNYANCDMVGHTGVFDAARKAVEAVDTGLGRLLEAVRRQHGIAVITADHGNAEMMIDPDTGGPWTAHTTNPVPCILYDPAGKLGKDIKFREGGILADIAPTLLDILGLDVPPEMTGKSLLIRG
ncbi:MAG: 2,3-bisphosphoglycerate-independent phosphoglycerate mutase [candidate division Zixibacteria bacterium]|nr:2,3-bisphosphoglycerate-independent phosphoglycerate mutase [candidate division Zixibacteria bacterium]